MRLVAITAGESDDARLAALCDAAAPGTLAIQVRARPLGDRALHALVVRVIAIARPRGAAVWVNDRLDVALAAGADGVHLPEAGFDVAAARAIAPRLAIGVSRHRPGDVGGGADLVQLGPIWPSPSKGAPLGVAALTQARAAVGGALIAVGGIDGPDRAHEAALAGADGVAVIRALWSSPDLAAAARALVAAVESGIRTRASISAP